MVSAELKLSALSSYPKGHGATPGSGCLNGVTLSPAPGEVTAILGPPKSGKSCLIASLGGFERTRGVIELDGLPIASLPAHRRGFGVVLQHDVLLPKMTLAENIAFPLRLRRHLQPEGRRLVAETLDVFQLGGVAHLRPTSVSPSLCRRAMLARAIVAVPRVLLLDEPFSEEAPAARAAMLASLRRLQGILRMTTLLATSSAGDALAIASGLVVLRDGTVLQHGSTEEVFNKPRNDFVAAVLGETNRLPGTIVEIDEDVAVLRLDCGVMAEAEPSDAFKTGDRCVLTIRPERIAIAAANAAGMGDHAIEATVLDVQFLGEVYRLRLLVGSGAEIVVRRPATAGLRGLVPGRRASIAWQPHQAAAFHPTPG